MKDKFVHIFHKRIFFAGSHRGVTYWPLTLFIKTTIDFCIGITKLYRNISEQLFEMSHSVLLGYCSNKCGFTMSDVTNCSNINCGLSRNNFCVKCSYCVDIEFLKYLWCEMFLRQDKFLLMFDDIFFCLSYVFELFFFAFYHSI